MLTVTIQWETQMKKINNKRTAAAATARYILRRREMFCKHTGQSSIVGNAAKKNQTYNLEKFLAFGWMYYNPKDDGQNNDTNDSK